MDPSPLDACLPDFDFGHRHEIEVPAPPDRVFAAAGRYSLAQSRATRLLFRLRGLPPPGAFMPSLRAIGFETLADEPGRLAVAGLAARLLAGGLVTPCPHRGAAAFRDLEAPRLVKIAASLRVTPRGEGAVLDTETRVRCSDRAARTIFALYWAVIRLPGGFIRRAMLEGIRREALGGS